MADDSTVRIRATGTPGAVEQLMAAIRGLDLEHITTEGPYQRNDGKVAFYAEIRLRPDGDDGEPEAWGTR